MDTTATSQTTGGATSKVGMATMIAGLCFIVGSLGSQVVDPLWILMIVGFALLIYALPALHRHQAPADGAAGEWGARLVVLGGAVIIALAVIFLVWELVGTPPEEGPTAIDVLFMVGFFSFLAGIILFAVGSIRAKAFPTGAPVLMLIGLVAGVAIDMATGAFFEENGDTTEWGFLIGVPLFGLSLAWIGSSVKSAGSAIASGGPATGGPAT